MLPCQARARYRLACIRLLQFLGFKAMPQLQVTQARSTVRPQPHATRCSSHVACQLGNHTLSVHCSKLIARGGSFARSSLLEARCSRLPHCLRLIAQGSLLEAHCSKFIARSSLLEVHYSRPIDHNAVLHCSDVLTFARGSALWVAPLGFLSISSSKQGTIWSNICMPDPRPDAVARATCRATVWLKLESQPHRIR